MTDYHLRCLGTGELLDDTNMPLQSEGACEPAFLRTEYGKKQITVGDASEGIYRFADWLPIRRTLEGSSAPVTYKSEGLAKELGLERLVMKQKRMIGYFISDQQSEYFQSETFSRVLAYIQKNGQTCVMKERETKKGLRLLITFIRIDSVSKAHETLRSI